MSNRKPRDLRPDEAELWDQVRKNAVPLHPEKRQPIKDVIARPKKIIEPAQPTPRFRVGERAGATALGHNLAPSISQQLAGSSVQMDRKSFGKMQRKLKPEGRIDLHGMTVAQAHPVLIRYILDAHADGKRLVLVITGKGKDKPDFGPIPVRRGVLKHQVPGWLQSHPLKPVVMQVSEAHLRHGGTGAYYVYLRRHR